MDKIIYKYELPNKPGQFLLGLPESAEIVHVGQQGDKICFWALFDIEEKHNVVLQEFYIALTGEPLKNSEGWFYLKTFTVEEAGRTFVGHLFWKGR